MDGLLTRASVQSDCSYLVLKTTTKRCKMTAKYLHGSKEIQSDDKETQNKTQNDHKEMQNNQRDARPLQKAK